MRLPPSYVWSYLMALCVGLAALWELKQPDPRALLVAWDVCALILNVLIGHRNRIAAL